jgi:putative ABC transport system permease protein
MQFLVTRRVREIGVRLALGARRGSVVGLVLAAAARVTIAGLAVGIPAGAAATRLVRALLYETGTFDVRVYAQVLVLLVGAALSAALVPAWRASRIDPMRAIRTE